MRTRLARVAGAALAVGLAFAPAACAPPAQERYEERARAAPEPAEHAVHGARLRDLMRGMERLRRERLPQALDVDAARAGRAGELAGVARAIADSAEGIADVAPVLGLDPDERTEFLILAAALRERALDLAAHAGEIRDGELRTRVAELEAACDRCHRRFRIPR